MIKLPTRLLLKPVNCLILLLLPCALLLLFLSHFWGQWQALQEISSEVSRVYEKNLSKEGSQKKESSFLEKLKKADHFYIDKHLESLTFLEPEIKKIEGMLTTDPLNVELKKRLQTLKSSANQLLFVEEKTRKSKGFSEIEEKQQYPVEMNEEDLKRTLSLIEGITIWPYGPKENPPQLIIRDLELICKDLPSQEKVFVVRMDLLRREYSE